MNKKTKLIGSSTGMLAIAAFSGLMLGATHRAAASTTSTVSSARTTVVAGTRATRMADEAEGKHACKGLNACKGQGGCKTGDAGCKGKNTCKGHGGCKTADTTAPAPGIL